MTEHKNLSFNIRSDTYNHHHPHFKTNIELSFHQPEAANNVTPNTQSAADLLQLSFHQAKKIPQEVDEYINQNLGPYVLTEDSETHLKVLSFELKINEIDSDKILKLYEDFFLKQLSQSSLKIHFSRSQNFDDFVSDLTNHYKVPILQQVLEHGLLESNLNEHSNLIEGFVQYLKSQNQLQLAQFLKNFECISFFKGDLVLTSYKKHFDEAVNFLGLDQKDLTKEFFLAFDNHLTKYIFETGQPGTLKIKGRILNILNYEVNVDAKNLAEFMAKVRAI